MINKNAVTGLPSTEAFARAPAVRSSSARPMRVRRAVGLSTALVACMLLTGCGMFDWLGFGDDNKPKEKLAGNRISVLQLDQQIEPDSQAQSKQVTLPDAVTNTDWAQPGGNAAHNPGHVTLPKTLKEAWKVSIEGSSSDNRLLDGPVVSEGKVYLLDTDFVLHAFDEATGKKVWDSEMKRPEQEGSAMGGGVAVGDGAVFVTTGYGEAIKVDPKDGKVTWRQRIAAPIRSGPTVAGGRVFVVTIDNQCIVLASNNRVLQWTHAGFPEPAALLGGASAAVENDITIIPYSSGELYALRVDNGHPAWSDNLASSRRGANLANLADIKGLPVVDRGLVYAISYSGRMVAIDQRTGQHVWEQDVGGQNQPAVVGDWVFVVNNEAQLVALTRDTGRVRWIKQLERWENPEKRKDPINWVGPIAAGGRLIMANSLGQVVEASPTNGDILNKMEFDDPISVAPIVVNNTLFVLTDDGDLFAYR
ncbi:PQQ-binding-like beta-propeller repeat protein [Nitrospirillum sp. BR 11164]|uniref:outer membrane protein assembly factor BamB family protein n=1 Tax=Nitrospirillum sp. BR 11164 TaxID=3104324 RepID=UPI002AFE6270|nr:PQQ-binding-like beta-propeller repeat protein [Nitrospirillum sp. BR 11164]MEA1650601.1 PQQ-binding-like beta-propeller repeat protein [Nitrospirillum sp. BR 11164]